MPVADYPAGARLPTRVIEDFEFVWMLRGRATFRSTDRDIVLTPDVLLLVPPGLEHSFDWAPSVLRDMGMSTLIGRTSTSACKSSRCGIP